MNERRRPRRLILPLIAAGMLVGAMVTAASDSFGEGSCGSEDALREAMAGLSVRVATTCRDLVRSLAVRTGIAAGLVSVGVFLLFVGLLRTQERLERDRREAAIERLREDPANR